MSTRKPLRSKSGVIIVRWYRHWRTGRRVYPKHARFIAFVPTRKKSA